MIAMFAAQVGYQLRMLARNPRGLMVSLFAPGLILVVALSRGAQHSASPAQKAAVIAGLSAFGLIATCYLTHAIGLVAARETGVLRRCGPARCRAGVTSRAGSPPPCWPAWPPARSSWRSGPAWAACG